MPEAALAAERDAASKGHRWSEIEQLRHEVDVAEGRRLGPQVPEHALGVCKVDPLLPGLPPVRCSRRAEDPIFETDLQPGVAVRARTRSEEHTSDIQSLMRTWSAVFCLKKNKNRHTNNK